jgi:hypothetical protein
VTSIRQRVRRIASRSSAASYGRKAIARASCTPRRPAAPAVAARCCRHRALGGLAQQVEDDDGPPRNDEDRDHRQGPGRGLRKHAPSQQQQQRQRRRHQAPAQVVEELPLRKRRQRIGEATLSGTRDSRQEPARKLPIAPDPAVTAAQVRAVARRVFLVELHIAQQCRARIAAFEQVVAKDAVLREAIGKRRLERIDVVDSLADERTLAEHVLVHVGPPRACKGPCPALRVQARVPGASRPGEADAHARLQDSVALGHDASRRVEARAVEGMRHDGDELPRAIARELRVGVERDHVAHRRRARRDRRRPARSDRARRAGRR